MRSIDAADDQPLQAALSRSGRGRGRCDGDGRPRQGAAVERRPTASRPRGSRGRRATAWHLAPVRARRAKRRRLSSLAIRSSSRSERCLDVLEVVELVRRRPQALAEQPRTVDRQGQLAAATVARAVPRTADYVSEVVRSMSSSGAGAPRQHGLAGVELDLTGAVAQVEEAGLAVATAPSAARRHGGARLGLDPGRQPLWAAAPRRCPRVRRLGREGVNPRLAQALQFLPPVTEDIESPRVVSLVICSARLTGSQGRSRRGGTSCTFSSSRPGASPTPIHRKS